MSFPPQVVKKYLSINAVALFFCFLFFIAGSIVSLHRFWQYETFFYDFGIFDMAIWRAAHFQAPIIEHFIHRGQWIFGDHFNPTIFLLSPLYWITDRSEIILLSQAALFSISGFILYRIGKDVTHNSLYSLAILSCYFLFIGVQNAVITDFHEVCLTVTFFMLIYWSFVKKRWFLYWIALFLMMGTKESNFTLGIGIGVSLFFLDRKMMRISIITIILSFVYGFIATRWIIPFFSHGGYQYAVPYSPNPLAYITSLIDHPTKIDTLIKTFASFSFLPLFSPAFYISILIDLLSRFYPPFLTLSWTLGLHYSAATGAIFAVSSLYAYRTVIKLVPSTRVQTVLFGGIILVSLFLYRIYHAPFALAYNPAFYQHTNDFAFLNQLVDAVPPTGTIMTQNNLAAHFSHRDVYLFESKCDTCQFYQYVGIRPTYIVIDGRDGQSPNNFYGLDDYKKFLAELLLDKDYHIIYHQNDQYIFKRR